jgi:hypothetical protein
MSIIIKELQQPVAQHSTLYKFGFNADVATNFEDIADPGGSLTWRLTASTVQVSSNDTDDVVGGAGARSVVLYGLDGSYNPVNETVSLSGIGVVSTTSSFLRVNRAIVATAGATGRNEGTIYIGNGGLSATSTASGSGTLVNIFAQVAAGSGQTLMAAWTVPNGQTFYLTNLFATSSVGGAVNVTVQWRLLARPENGAWNTKHEFITGGADVNLDLSNTPIVFAEKTDIVVQAKASGGTEDCSAAFAGVLT